MNARLMSLPPMLILALLLFTTVGGPAQAETQEPLPDTDPYAELAELSVCAEVLRHLYRWYLDESDLDALLHEEWLTLYLAPLDKSLDEGDRSLFASLLIPALRVAVRLKRTDYVIEELGIHVHSDHFRIVNVKKTAKDRAIPADARVLRFPKAEIMDYLFRTRYQPDRPSPELIARLRATLKDRIKPYLDHLSADDHLTVFIGPLSPVANEAWAFWYDAKLLFYWSSDIDLNNPAAWEHEDLSVTLFDIEKQVLLSFSEAPGSNAYLSRDHVGRIIYNCTIFGEAFRVTDFTAWSKKETGEEVTGAHSPAHAFRLPWQW